MQRRRVLGKRQLGESSATITKRIRSDQEVPNMEDEQQSGFPSSMVVMAGTSSSPDGAAAAGITYRRLGKHLVAKVPRFGTPVERNRVRTAGPYVIGHELGTSPGVPQTQYLARKQTTGDFYLLKILSYDIETEANSKETQQGKTLLHTEYTLLTLLSDLDGVIHHHGLFSDYALEEKQIETTERAVQHIYTGRIRKRLILVLDCVHAHDFCPRSVTYVNLQKYVQTHKFSELEALMVFYEIVKVVEQLHKRNVIHRDLKLNNIVLNRRTNKIVITNFFLAKHLISEDDNLYDQRGSPAYISPDVLGGKPYKGKPSDVWALGVILYTIAFGKFPFLDSTPSALFKKIRLADYTIPLETKASHHTIHLIKSMLTLNPAERFTAAEVRVELERAINTLRGPKIEIDQIVPECPLATIETNDDVNSTTPSTSRSSGEQQSSTSKISHRAEEPKVGAPNAELARNAFSRVLEANARRENESFLRPRSSWVNRGVMLGAAAAVPAGTGGTHTQQHRLNTPTVRTFTSTPGNRVTLLAGTARALGRNRPNLAGNIVGHSGIGDSASTTTLHFRAPTATSVTTTAGAGGGVATIGANNQRETVQVRLAPMGAFGNNLDQHVFAATPVNPPSTVTTAASPLFVHVDAQALNHLINIQNSVHAQAQQIVTGSGPLPSSPFHSPPVASLFAAMNELFTRGQIPPPNRAEATEFHGVITPEMADKIVTWLLANFRSHTIIQDIFGSGNSNSNSAVTNVVELLRRCGVQIDFTTSRGAVVKVEQTLDILMFMTYLLQVAGMNNNYFITTYYPS